VKGSYGGIEIGERHLKPPDIGTCIDHPTDVRREQ